MAKTWILDTETKGTGAHVAPLAESKRRSASAGDLALVEFDRPRRAPEPSEPPAPLEFKVVDVRSSTLLAEGVDVREVVDLLGRVGSVTDIRIYVWRRAPGRWRLLTLGEQKALWGFREPAAPDA